jgi:EpsI family protein
VNTVLFRPAVLKSSVLAIVVALMLGCVGAAEALKPRKFWADVIGEPHYETIIPRQFGDWQEVVYASKAVVNPVQEENLMRLYSETFARTFVHKPTGRAIMLSIAYGRDQSNDTQLHTPDACYPSQGFRVDKRMEEDVKTSFGDLKSVRLLTTMGSQRTEPLTYFVRVGDGVARGSRDRNIARLKMAMRGYRVDGMLFRVSEVTRNESPYGLQDAFIQDLLNNVSAETRRKIIGSQ